MEVAGLKERSASSKGTPSAAAQERAEGRPRLPECSAFQRRVMRGLVAGEPRAEDGVEKEALAARVEAEPASKGAAQCCVGGETLFCRNVGLLGAVSVVARLEAGLPMAGADGSGMLLSDCEPG